MTDGTARAGTRRSPVAHLRRQPGPRPAPGIGSADADLDGRPIAVQPGGSCGARVMLVLNGETA